MSLQFHTSLTPNITSPHLIFTTAANNALIYPSGNRISQLDLTSLNISQCGDEHRSNIHSVAASSSASSSPNDTSASHYFVSDMSGYISVFSADSGKRLLQFRTMNANIRDIAVSGRFLLVVHPSEWKLYYFNKLNNDNVFDEVFLSKPTLVYSYSDPSVQYVSHETFGKIATFYSDSLFMATTADGSTHVFSIDASLLDDVQVEQWILAGQGMGRSVGAFFDDTQVLKHEVKDEEGSENDSELSQDDQEEEDTKRRRDMDKQQFTSLSPIPDNMRMWILSTTKELTVWRFTEGKWNIEKKHSFSRMRDALSIDFHFEKGLMVIGVKGGFHLYSLDNLNTPKEDFVFSKLKKHPTLQQRGRDIQITTIKFSLDGDWIALASHKVHDLLIIYDHESKSFVLKQESHRAPVKCLAYSHMGDILATGDEKGEIKVWDLRTNQCFVTLTSHDGPITSLKFSRPPNSRDIALFSSSLDGTCRAFDLLRYRNFRTFVAPDAVPFTCMATDLSGELIAAAGQEEFGIHLWNVVTSQLLDVLKNHQGPVTCMAFSPNSDVLATGSWDKTAKVWTIHSAQCMTLEHSTEVVHLAFRPDGAQIVTSTTDGTLTFWDALNTGEMNGFISGSRDIRLESRSATESTTRVSIESEKYYTRVCYTSDGQNVIAGSFNQFLNMYNVDRKVLIKQFVISENLSLDGMVNLNSLRWYDKMLHRWRIIEQKKKGKQLAEGTFIPGAEEEQLPRVQCDDLVFNPTNSELAVTTPGGVTLFKTDVTHSFQPLEIDPTLTKHSIRSTIQEGEYGKALIMSIKLNEASIAREVFSCIPKNDIPFICRSFPLKFLEQFIRFLSEQLEDGTQIEYVLSWIENILQIHGPHIQHLNIAHLHSLTNSSETVSSSGLLAVLRALLRALLSNQRRLQDMSEENNYSLKYLLSFRGSSKKESISDRQKEKDEKRVKKEMKKRKRQERRSEASKKARKV